MIEKPTLLVLSSIAIGIIVMMITGTSAQSSSQANQPYGQAQTEISKNLKEKTTVGSDYEPAQQQNSQNTAAEPNPNLKEKTTVGSKYEQAQNQNPNVKVLITEDNGMINILKVNTDTGDQISRTLSFPGTVTDSKIVGDELQIISEVQSNGHVTTEFRNIDLVSIYLINYNQIQGRISQILP